MQAHPDASQVDVRPMGLVMQVPSRVSLNPYKHLPGVSLNTSERSLVMFGKLSTMHLKGWRPSMSKGDSESMYTKYSFADSFEQSHILFDRLLNIHSAMESTDELVVTFFGQQ